MIGHVLSDFLNKILDVILPFIVPALIIGAVAGALFVIIIKPKKASLSLFISAFLTASYGSLIVFETIIRRLDFVKETEDFLGFKQLLEDPWYVVAAVENVIMFLPLGFTLAWFFKCIGIKRKKSLLIIIPVIVIFTIIIEVLQYTLVIGEAQVLDVLTAALGALMGWLLEYCVNCCIFRK